MAARRAFVGTAGWSIPRACADRVAGEGTQLQRYARQLRGTEINSTFYRPPRPSTLQRWAAATPDDFRFSVKMPREITHERRLVDVEAPLERFLEGTAALGAKRGPLLAQFPPSFEFDAVLVTSFLDVLRQRYDGPVACEPRHPTWLTVEAETLLAAHRVARVAADPARAAGAERPGGWSGLVYYRWHGSPRVYWSRYDDAALDALAHDVRRCHDGAEVWCVFDNTASGAALENALDLRTRLKTAA